MTDFVVIKRFIDPDQREWIRVGDLKTLKEAVPSRVDAERRPPYAHGGSERSKASIVRRLWLRIITKPQRTWRRTAAFCAINERLDEWDRNSHFTIFFMYMMNVKTLRGKKPFVLIGNEAAVRDYTKPENTIIGWVPMSKLFLLEYKGGSRI